MKKIRNYQLFVVLIILLTFAISACKKDSKKGPEISTNEVTEITHKSAVGGGIIISDGDSPITKQGVCWSTETNPTIDNSYSIDDGEGKFSSNLTSLAEKTTYYVRAYATNETETAYGNEVSFTTAEKPVTSFSAKIDGKSFYPSFLSKSISYGIIQISAMQGMENMIIRMPEDVTVGSHDVSLDLTSYSGQYISSSNQMFTTRTEGGGQINILQYDVNTGHMEATFEFIVYDPNSSDTRNITSGHFEVTFNK